MSASHSKVVVNHEGDLSPSQEPILFLGFLLLEADLLFELGILDDLVQSRGNLRVSISKSGNSFRNLIARISTRRKNPPSPLF